MKKQAFRIKYAIVFLSTILLVGGGVKIQSVILTAVQ